jgi:hypothetical protein
MGINLPNWVVWPVNGFLAVLYTLLDRIFTVLLLGVLIWIFVKMSAWVGERYSARMRAGYLAACAVSLAASLLVGSPVPFMLAVMAIVTLGALLLKLEKLQPSNVVWSFIRGMILYSLAGLGFLLMNNYLQNPSAASSTSAMFLLQGQNYLGLLSGVVLYLMPVGYLAILLKDLLLGKPVGNPVDAINDIRTGRRR